MTLPFALAVRTAMPGFQPGTVVLEGPVLGGRPEAGARLSVHDGARVWSVAFRGLGTERVRGQAVPVVVVSTPHRPAELQEAWLCEEGLVLRTFEAHPRHRVDPTLDVARFELDDGGAANGFIRVTGGRLQAVVVGGGLPEGADLWRRLSRLTTPSSLSLTQADLLPARTPNLPFLRSGWLAPTSAPVPLRVSA